MDELDLVEPSDGHHQGIAVDVDPAACGRLDARFCQPFGERILTYGDLLSLRHIRPPYARVAGIKGLLHRIEHEVRLHRVAHPSAYNAPAERVTRAAAAGLSHQSCIVGIPNGTTRKSLAELLGSEGLAMFVDEV